MANILINFIFKRKEHIFFSLYTYHMFTSLKIIRHKYFFRVSTPLKIKKNSYGI